MLFSSTVFLFVFLPLLLFFFFFVKENVKKYVLVLFSLLFYAWGEPRHLAVMLMICFISYISAIAVSSCALNLYKRLYLCVAILFDLFILGYYKYANFFIENINGMFSVQIPSVNVIMPIGISFFTFQAMSYVIDVYREEVKVQYSLIKLVLYISFFPQLIAGPIVKYHDIEVYLSKNVLCFEDLVYGTKRFVVGLGKKCLIANPLGAVADNIFDTGFQSADMQVAWLGTLAYSLQLYFDFSGYSDMAIGLGRMFGFRYLENFNFPYISKSITEFWRRWHISLGTWFKEYVYIPLGGNRCGKIRTYINLFIVFLVTGLWHGADWTFVVWGLWHGVLVILEKMLGLISYDKKPYNYIMHVYAMIAVVLGWTMFRAESLTEGVGFIKLMLGFEGAEYIPFDVWYYLSTYNVTILLVALVMAMPFGSERVRENLIMIRISNFAEKPYGVFMVNTILIMIFLLSISALASSTYNPFIYFRF